ncbi:hypothetical protein SDC9_164122 [bioreactor metagenome]|uniref:Uncharacterized protein n=1 Tax=bioreactor metagenome TaxID=1076179 RepID=A0A645FSS8_9ZZZZ
MLQFFRKPFAQWAQHVDEISFSKQGKAFCSLSLDLKNDMDEISRNPADADGTSQDILIAASDMQKLSRPRLLSDLGAEKSQFTDIFADRGVFFHFAYIWSGLHDISPLFPIVAKNALCLTLNHIDIHHFQVGCLDIHL